LKKIITIAVITIYQSNLYAITNNCVAVFRIICELMLIFIRRRIKKIKKILQF